jgi:hypothetical protein
VLPGNAAAADHLPESLGPLVALRREGGYRLALRDYAEVERVIAELRAAGIAIQELEPAGPGGSIRRSRGGMNPSRATGFWTLFRKEGLRFWKVSVQTILAPVLTALLYLVVFAYALRGRVEVFPGVDYAAFLVPGLAMMSVLQNAFANSSSSLMQSKMTGNIIFVLLPPFSHPEFFGAYLLAAVARGVVVGAGVFAVTAWFVDLEFQHPLWAAVFALAGSGVMGVLGIVAGIHSDKVDELAAFQNFIILPRRSFRRVLLHPFPAAHLAGCVVPQSHLLYGGRVSLRILRGERRLAVALAGVCRGEFLRLIIFHPMAAALRLQAQALK